MNIESREYGTTTDGQLVTAYTCDTGKMKMTLLDYGATMTELAVPDRNGKVENVTLACNSVEAWENCTAFLGSTVGRFCNRIANGQFKLNGKAFQLATNDAPHHLHGGNVGFNRKMWAPRLIDEAHKVGIEFSYRSPDGEENFPGNVDVKVCYTLTTENELLIEFTASTDQPTPINLTNHNYWNLIGEAGGKILDHEVEIAGERFVEVNDALIPTGNYASVKQTPMDFLKKESMGSRLFDIKADPIGYDHCYVLRESPSETPQFAARVYEPNSGRVMEVHTTQPGIQLYTGNFLDGTEGSGGFNQHCGFCLETQHFPDSPNQPSFPTTILEPGQVFQQTTIHKFSTRQ